MSNAKKCDRCGKFYDFYEGLEYIPNQNLFNCITLYGEKSKIFDLCPSCMKSLFDWLDCEKIVEAGSEQARWRDGE